MGYQGPPGGKAGWKSNWEIFYTKEFLVMKQFWHDIPPLATSLKRVSTRFTIHKQKNYTNHIGLKRVLPEVVLMPWALGYNECDLFEEMEKAQSENLRLHSGLLILIWIRKGSRIHLSNQLQGIERGGGDLCWGKSESVDVWQIYIHDTQSLMGSTNST